MDGAKLTYVPPKTGTSGNAQVYKVEGGTLALKRFNIVHLLLMPRSNRCMWVSAIKLHTLMVLRLRLLILRPTDRHSRGLLSPFMMQTRHT